MKVDGTLFFLIKLSFGVGLWTLAGWRQLTGFHLLVGVYCL